MNDFPWLTVLWLTPVVGAVVVMILPAKAREAAKWVALAFALVVLVLAVLLAIRFEPGGAHYQFVESHQLDPGAGHPLRPRRRRDRPGADAAHRGVGAVAADRGVERRPRRGGPAPACRAHLRRADPARRGDGADLVLRPRCPAVLHLLRGHAHSDVLPHRRLRAGREGLAGGGEVPALQPVRRADHAGRGDRAVRDDGPGRARARSTSGSSSKRSPRVGSTSTLRSRTRCSSASCSRSR